MKINCSKCGQPYDVPEALVGKKVECQICNTKFIVQKPLPEGQPQLVVLDDNTSSGTEQLISSAYSLIRKIKDNALRYALICLAAGSVINLIFYGMHIVYTLLFLAALVLGVYLVMQRRLKPGIAIALASLVLPSVISYIRIPSPVKPKVAQAESFQAPEIPSPVKSESLLQKGNKLGNDLDDFTVSTIPKAKSESTTKVIVVGGAEKPVDPDTELAAKLKERSELRVRYGVNSIPIPPEERAERKRLGIDDELTAKENFASKKEHEAAERDAIKKLVMRSSQRLLYGSEAIPLPPEEKAERKRLGLDDELTAQEEKAANSAKKKADRELVNKLKARSEMRVKVGAALVPFTPGEKDDRKRLGLDDELTANENDAQKKSEAVKVPVITPTLPKASLATPTMMPTSPATLVTRKRGIKLDKVEAVFLSQPLGISLKSVVANDQDKGTWQINLELRQGAGWVPHTCKLNDMVTVDLGKVKIIDCNSNEPHSTATIELAQGEKILMKQHCSVYPPVSVVSIRKVGFTQNSKNVSRDSGLQSLEVNSRFIMDGIKYQLVEIDSESRRVLLLNESDKDYYEIPLMFFYIPQRLGNTGGNAVSVLEFSLPKDNAAPSGPYVYTGTQINSGLFEQMYAYFSQCLYKCGNSICDARDRDGKVKSRMENKRLTIWSNGQALHGAQPISRKDFVGYIKNNNLYVYVVKRQDKNKFDEKDVGASGLNDTFKRNRKVLSKEEFDPYKAKFPMIYPADDSSYISRFAAR